jgi:hypothetical protein
MKAILENLVLKPAEAIGNGILQALTVIAILLERLGVLKTSQNTPDNSKPSPHDLLASSHVRFAS